MAGDDQGYWAEEVARLERAIAEMKQRDIKLLREQRLLSQELQAALFQRDMLSAAGKERAQQQTRQTRRVLRRRPGRRPPTADPGDGPRIPRQAPDHPAPPHLPPQRGAPEAGADSAPGASAWAGGGTRTAGPRVAPPPPGPRVAPPPPPPPGPDEGPAQPEASSREIQNVFLGLGALLLGVAAVVFAAVTDEPVSRLAILLIATALMMAAAPWVARRGLISTAETIAAVGLALVPLNGYGLYTVEAVRTGPVSATVFAGVVFAVTAAVAAGYGSMTGLSVPRYATVLALQPVLPLLFHDWIVGPTGWALALSGVAALDIYLGRQLAAHGRLVPPSWSGRFGAPPSTAAAPGRGPGRPEAAPEEDDVLIGTEPSPVDLPPHATSVRVAASARWLRELTWVLHGLAVGAALIYGVAALVQASTIPTAVSGGATLMIAAGVGLAGTFVLRQRPLSDVAGGVMTLAVIGAASRVAAVALPGRALIVIGATITVVALGVRSLPESGRRGPQLASTAALLVMGVVVAGAALRAAFAPVRAAYPTWDADLGRYPRILADAVGPAQWQLAVAAALLTIAAVLAAPPEVRRELAVAGTTITAVAAPASFNLPWSVAPWPPVVAAIGIGVVGLWARTPRAAQAHVLGALVVGLVAAGASGARPGLSGAVLFAIAGSGALIAATARTPEMRARSTSAIVGAWAAGGAALAFPGAVASFVAATVAGASVEAATVPILATAFLAVCATLGYAAMTQVAERHIGIPLMLGTGFGAIAVTVAAFAAPGAGAGDMWVGALLLFATVMLFLSPSIDSGRRADRLLDGADVAAAAATVALIGSLTRIAEILAPGGQLVTAAGLVLIVAVGVRALPPEWRRGPAVGVAAGGAVIAAIAGYTAVIGAVRILAMPGPLWDADLSAFPGGLGGSAWQAPVALVLVGGTAAVALPRPWSYDLSGICVGLATIGAPAALGLPWWSPIVVGGAVATVYGIAAVMAADPRAGTSRVAVAAAVMLHAVGASVVRPWTSAAALAIVVVLGVVVAGLARAVTTIPAAESADVLPDVPTDDMPAHLSMIGGLALGGALLALPGTLAAYAAELEMPADVVLTAALAGASLGTALLALARKRVAPYLPYASLGIAGGATVAAATAFAVGLPVAVYAAAAALLGVLAEMLRATVAPGGDAAEGVRRWTAMRAPMWRRPLGAPGPRWSVDPAMGAILVAAPATLIALVALGPALVTSLFDPLQTLQRIWEGPAPALVDPPASAVDPANVLAALLLTLATALAAVGFSRGRTARVIPVVLPGIAVTVLITPVSLGLAWPHTTMAALAVFTIAMLGLALTPPPAESEISQSLRITRVAVFAIGLAAGNAGLAGSLAERPMTLFTLGSAVAVGLVAALGGRTQRARILGWLFAAVMAQAFVLTVGLVAGLPRTTSAFGVLAVGAALLVVASTLPRLRRPQAVHEASTLEWSGYGGALIAVALAFDSRPHLAGLLAAWGAILGISATRPGRREAHRRALFYTALACEVVAWWLLMDLARVVVIEAYTLPFAAVALLAGLIELRQRPHLGSWVAYGPALVAAFVPTAAVVLTSDTADLREVLLLLGGVATLIFGAMRQQQAPVIVGAVVTAISAIHFTITQVGPYYVVFPIGVILLILGASNENRRRVQERLRSMRGMR